jgi:hypothetical protein
MFGELTLTIFIPLPPFPEKPTPKPGETLEQIEAARRKALAPAEDAFRIISGVLTLGASEITRGAVEATKAIAQDARAMTESLFDEPSAEERYARFQQEVMPAAAAGFVDQLELYALVGDSERRLNGADFTMVSEYRPGTPLLVSVRGRITTPVTRASIAALVIKSGVPLPAGCRVIVNSASVRYQTDNFRHDMINDQRVNDDIDLPIVASTGTPTVPGLPVPLPPGFPTKWNPIPGVTPVRVGSGAMLYTPLDEWEQRSPRHEDVRLSAKLVEHLNANLEYYHHAIWWTMDPNRRYMFLDGYQAPNAGGRSVASVVDNTLIGIVGNSLILPVAPGNRLDPEFKYAEGVTLLEHYDPQLPAPPSRVSLPTRGVFAEAVMGDCNACEEIDDTRFWRWEESPIDEPPALDMAALASRRSEPNYGTPTPFPTPIVNIQNAPQAPEPAGVKSALDAITKQSFADITGLAGTQANAAAAFAKAMDTALAFGKEASQLAQQASMTKNLAQTTRAIETAKQQGKISDEDETRHTNNTLDRLTMTPPPHVEAEPEGSLPEEWAPWPGSQSPKQSTPPKKTGSINVLLRANYSDKQPIAADVRVVFTGQGQAVPFERRTTLGNLEGVAEGYVSLKPGRWAVQGQILVLRLPDTFNTNIPVAIGGETYNLDISSYLSKDSNWRQFNGIVDVIPGTRTLDLQVTAVLKEFQFPVEIEVANSGSKELGGEISGKVEPSILKVVKLGEVGGKIEGKATWADATKKKLNFTFTTYTVQSIDFNQEK